jgi:hypothetical protein
LKKTLNLGCGQNPRNPFYADEVFGVDIVKSNQKNILLADLVIEKFPQQVLTLFLQGP